MVIDITGIGKDMKSISIFGDSNVPAIVVEPTEIDIGEIFLRNSI